MTADNPVARAISGIGRGLWSENVLDSNGETANVVDALSDIARALHRIAQALETDAARDALRADLEAARAHERSQRRPLEPEVPG